MVKRLFLLSLLLLRGCGIPCPVGAQSLYKTSRLVLYSGLALDLASTEPGMGRQYRELNPALGQNRVRRIGTAVGLTIGFDLLSHIAKKDGHPKIAAGMNFAAGAVHFSFAVRNLKVDPNLKTR